MAFRHASHGRRCGPRLAAVCLGESKMPADATVESSRALSVVVGRVKLVGRLAVAAR